MRLHRAGYSLRLHDTVSAVAHSGDRYISGLEHGYNVLRYFVTLKLSALCCTYVAQSSAVSRSHERRRSETEVVTALSGMLYPSRHVRCPKLQDSLPAAALPCRQFRSGNVLSYNVLCCIVTSLRYDVILSTASILHQRQQHSIAQ